MHSLRGSFLSAVLCLVASSAAQATYTIDNFTTATNTIFQGGAGTTTSAATMGAGILGSRTLALTVASPLNSATADAGLSSGLAEASFNGNYSNPSTANKFAVTESFSAVNAIADNDTAVSFNLGSSLGVTVTITANGTSTATITLGSNPGGAVQNVSFASFSNPAVFSNLTSLVFTETFPNPGVSGPSVAFSGPIILTNPSSVPEPAAIAMIAQAGLVAGLFGAGRRISRRRATV